MDSKGLMAHQVRIAVAVQQRRQLGGKLPAVLISIGETLACQTRQQC